MKKVCSNKNCHLAGIEQDINNFYYRKDSGKYRNECKACFSEKRKVYRENNKEEIKEDKAFYYELNKDLISIKYKKYYEKNKETIIENNGSYYEKNKEKVKMYKKEYFQLNKRQIQEKKTERMNSDISFALHHNVSSSIRSKIKKNSKSCVNYLPYSFVQLKEHLEKQFEPWMNWNNWGTYNPQTWDDNNPLTWTWQIDHIIPQSNLLYTSMEDENFKKCWSLSNLRPYSAKQNLLDGVMRIRHD